jgi:hypothetical protein
MRDYFHELYGDDPFDDERRVVPDGGSVRAPVTFHLADGKDAESLRRRPAAGATQSSPPTAVRMRHLRVLHDSMPRVARSNKSCNPPYQLGLGQQRRVTLIRHYGDFELVAPR